jgi:hypothetical protein
LPDLLRWVIEQRPEGAVLSTRELAAALGAYLVVPPRERDVARAAAVAGLARAPTKRGGRGWALRETLRGTK